MKEIIPKDQKVEKALNEIFGESEEEFKERLKSKSIFGNL